MILPRTRTRGTVGWLQAMERTGVEEVGQPDTLRLADFRNAVPRFLFPLLELLRLLLHARKVDVCTCVSRDIHVA